MAEPGDMLLPPIQSIRDATSSTRSPTFLYEIDFLSEKHLTQIH